jgi:hypothetical protein
MKLGCVEIILYSTIDIIALVVLGFMLLQVNATKIMALPTKFKISLLFLLLLFFV